MASPIKTDITFSAASTAGLNNPGTEIVTLVKDGSGNFINPPSYDKMRAYLRSGEVPMLFVTDEGGETGSLYQLVEYSETENKIRFSNDANAIEFGAGAAAPVVSDVVPKPLTYDYMPEGFDPKGIANQQFVTDETGTVKWEDKDVCSVIFTLNVETGEITADKTFNDVKSAYIQGKEVRALYKFAMGAEQKIQGWSSACNYHNRHGTLYFLFPIPSIRESNHAQNNITVVSMDATQIKESSGTRFFGSTVFGPAALRMESSTPGSTKNFKITVDDSGTISATEVT